MYTMFLNKNPVAMKFFVQGHGNTNISDASCNLQGDAAPSFVCWCINPVKYSYEPHEVNDWSYRPTYISRGAQQSNITLENPL